MVKTNWVYSLRKEELTAYMEELGIEGGGTVDELRKQLVEFIKNGEHKAEVQRRLEILEQKHSRSISPAKHGETTQAAGLPIIKVTKTGSDIYNQEELENNKIDTAMETDASKDRAKYQYALEQVRKWSFRYDGSKDPLEFLERVEELAEMYEIVLDLLPRTMPELLKDLALSWYRNNNKRWSTWKEYRGDFLGYFLPSGYFTKLEDKIRARKQQANEGFKVYMVVLQDLMRQASYSEEQKLERLYENMNPKYRLYVKRGDFKDLYELAGLADDFENIQKETPMVQYQRFPAPQPRAQVQSNSFNRQHNPVAISGQFNKNHQNSAAIEGPINASTACRRCGQEGHGYRFCKNQSVLFCWDCGRKDVRTVECCRKQAGNAQGLRQ